MAERKALRGHRPPARVKPYVRFNPVFNQGLRTVRVLLGDGTPKAVSDGGWEFVARPKRRSFTSWGGQDPYTLTIPLMFDGLARDNSVENDLEALRQIMRKPVGKMDQPSPVRISGPLPMTNRLWVIQSLTPNEEIRRETDGDRVRASAEIVLLEYVEADVVVKARPSPAKDARDRKNGKKDDDNGGGGKKGARRIYVVKRGDTLSAIAQKQLGSYRRWHEIAKMNDIRDPKNIQPGDRLRLP